MYPPIMKKGEYMLSQKFIERLKLSDEPAYLLAWEAGMHPNTLSKLITGYLRPRPNDVRLIRVGKLLGLKPEEVFCTENDYE